MNERIIKVFHGAADKAYGPLTWLQRDFGIRCKNVFDTEEFCRLLHHSKTDQGKDTNQSLSLAVLQKQYCNNKQKNYSKKVIKRLEGTDWINMKLTREMVEYAAHASHFLIHITHQVIKEAKS